MKENSTKLNTGNTNKKDNKKKRPDFIEEMKMEIASELGIIQQVKNEGWDSLSPRISGKIGGKLSQRLKRINK
ncbi:MULTISPECIES: small, acid-soluble spore protein, alpha/beta type [unclassified Dehalobacter]|uniref:small, acid-soluble spore protein, alpha/beta type n=1 Tax=unclassified Dehalobacter TaxID=2635733 RepID=UPI000E6CE797|nr:MULTISPECIES: small, acid-soluble spore protein, alpha/beta type [unclassified Dehalobacter]RJE46883.1 spore protein [Dehalobacter sp. MCB1]TCX50806.1 small, acid-soluble spore protein, alpha/beta type [Dehalobacter sp. 12DCB1]TCX51517.1 small, acid-soluble spore protein, alpha/beta type [Dehalobacter sp. 14DCB1]